MTPQDIIDLLDEVKPFLIVPKGKIDKQNETVKKFIKTYQTITGIKLGLGNCQNCLTDAFFNWKTLTEKQLIFLTMERKYKIKETRLIGFNGSHYNNGNITDEIALAMVAANRNHSKGFENGEELLADLGNTSDDVQVDSPKATQTKPQPKNRGGRRKG